jgi:hypothetical protein
MNLVKKKKIGAEVIRHKGIICINSYSLNPTHSGAQFAPQR